MNLLEPKKAWFINVSNIFIPNDIIGLLQLDESFCLPTQNKDRDIVECIKSVENNFYKHGLSSNTFRNKVFPLIKSTKNNNRCKTDLDIFSAASSTKKFVSCNSSVVFTRANKGNIVVALDRIDYINKMEKNLSDTNTF